MISGNYFFRYGDDISNEYVAMDIDDDGYLEYSEFYDVMDDLGYYKRWDMNNDGYLNQQELANFLFHKWDLDDNQCIEPDEYAEFDMHYPDF